MSVDSAKKAVQVIDDIFRICGNKCPDVWLAVTGSIMTPEREHIPLGEVRETERLVFLIQSNAKGKLWWKFCVFNNVGAELRFAMDPEI